MGSDVGRIQLLWGGEGGGGRPKTGGQVGRLGKEQFSVLLRTVLWIRVGSVI